jgi:hypothetical protein
MDDLHYASVNADAEYPCEWIFYDTFYRQMDAVRDVCPDVSSAPTDSWMI